MKRADEIGHDKIWSRALSGRIRLCLIAVAAMDGVWEMVRLIVGWMELRKDDKHEFLKSLQEETMRLKLERRDAESRINAIDRLM